MKDIAGSNIIESTEAKLPHQGNGEESNMIRDHQLSWRAQVLLMSSDGSNISPDHIQKGKIFLHCF